MIEHLGKELGAWRRANKYSQAKIAKILNTSVSSLSDYENEKTKIPQDLIDKVIDLIQVERNPKREERKNLNEFAKTPLVNEFYQIADDMNWKIEPEDYMLITNCETVSMRLFNDISYEAILILVSNCDNGGRALLKELSNKEFSNHIIERENTEIISWFINDYYTGVSLLRDRTRTYELTSATRSIARIIYRSHLGEKDPYDERLTKNKLRTFEEFQKETEAKNAEERL